MSSGSGEQIKEVLHRVMGEGEEQQSLITKYGRQIIDVCVQEILEGDNESDEYNRMLVLTRIIVEIQPKIGFKKIKIISKLLESCTSTNSKGEICLLLKVLFEYIINHKSDYDSVSLKVMKDLEKNIESIITKEPLKLTFNSLELLILLSRLQADY